MPKGGVLSTMRERVPAAALSALRQEYPKFSKERLKQIYRRRLRTAAAGKVRYEIVKGTFTAARDYLCVTCAHDHSKDPSIDHQWDHFKDYSPENALAVEAVCLWCHTAAGLRRGTYGLDRRRYTPEASDDFVSLLCKVFICAHTWRLEELRALIQVTKFKWSTQKVDSLLHDFCVTHRKKIPGSGKVRCGHVLLRQAFHAAGAPASLRWFFCTECCKPIHVEYLAPSEPLPDVVINFVI